MFLRFTAFISICKVKQINYIGKIMELFLGCHCNPIKAL